MKKNCRMAQARPYRRRKKEMKTGRQFSFSVLAPPFLIAEKNENWPRTHYVILL